MSTVRDIEQAIEQLNPEDLAKFRNWFVEFDAAQWDAQIERDAASGKLDALAERAIDALKKGHCTEL